MLLQFKIENFATYKKQSCLDMNATNIKEHEYAVVDFNSDIQVLPFSVIYGANSAGKTNLLKALSCMKKFVLYCLSMSDKQGLPAIPFAGNTECLDKPTNFEISFILDGDKDEQEYLYGFSITAKTKTVEAEYLYHKKIKHKSYNIIFERTVADGLKLGKGVFARKKLGDTKEIRYINKLVKRKRDLFLTFLGQQLESSLFSDILLFFNNIVDYSDVYFPKMNPNRMFISGDDLTKYYKESHLKDGYLNFMRLCDNTILDLTISEEEIPDANNEKGFEVNIHHNIGEKTLLFPLTWNSNGTFKAMQFYPILNDVLESGGILIVDELDSSLHPILLKYVVNMFRDPQTNPKHAQLICSLHNTFLMDKKYLRRDEIWFVDKHSDGDSELYSLAEFNIRSDADYSKQYIIGKLGAVPNLNI